MSLHYEVKKEDFLISTDPVLLEMDVIHGYLSGESYWAQGIPLPVLQKALSNSLCFGLYREGHQVGFARLVTDKATFAYLADVFILPEQRGRGLSKWLIEVIQSHPELQGLRRWMLMTRDAQGLYKQFGWTVLDEDARQRSMQRHFKDIYQKQD
ncbi:MAG: GNAT family N-acetyltransferase [Sphingobacteriales bacterium]|nr:GNAT family N-acetyltransferase [Sphingobacteriales bacterium]